ncbi:MAG: YigZ family protein [Bacteroidia bacterium]|nr:YigZ family protein [Bacteroidia bacterium]
MQEALYIPQAAGTGEFRDRGSRFLAYAWPVTRFEEIDPYQARLRKEFFDARHHCYAYRLGMKGETTFASDDGEPSHSAGTPILSAIRAENLTQVLVIVVRYFGGTKLGVRGLIDAYRTAATEALHGIPRILVVPRVLIRLEYPYTQTADLQRIMHRVDAAQISAEYTDRCVQTLAINEADFPALRDRLDQARIVWHHPNQD